METFVKDFPLRSSSTIKWGAIFTFSFSLNENHVFQFYGFIQKFETVFT